MRTPTYRPGQHGDSRGDSPMCPGLGQRIVHGDPSRICRTFSRRGCLRSIEHLSFPSCCEDSSCEAGVHDRRIAGLSGSFAAAESRRSDCEGPRSGLAEGDRAVAGTGWLLILSGHWCPARGVRSRGSLHLRLMRSALLTHPNPTGPSHRRAGTSRGCLAPVEASRHTPPPGRMLWVPCARSCSHFCDSSCVGGAQ